MGQVQGSQADEDSCFRACLRQKRQNLGKRPPPPFVSNSQQHIQAANIVRNLKPPDQGTSGTPGHHKNTPQTRAGETSIEDRLEQSMSPERAVIDGLNPAARMSADQGKLPQPSPADEEGILLGLQSKFSSSRRTVIGKTGTTTRITTVSEGLGTRSNWEVGISDQTNTKSHGASTESTKSRNILLNKIEGVKQKYYQRELEIEICQNQNEYEDQLEHRDSRSRENVEQSRVKAGESRVRVGEDSSIREARDVASVRQKIIQKLNKRKMLKHRKSNKERNQNEQSGATDGFQELQLFSKEGKPVLEEPLDRSNGVLNEDLNQSARSARNRGDVSIEDRMQFSGYSQQETLHEIRECDEDEEDYKSRVESNRKNSQVRRSKMVPPRFSNLTSLKKSRDMGLNGREEGSLGERKEEMSEERKEEMAEERKEELTEKGDSGRSVVRLQSGTGTKIFVF